MIMKLLEGINKQTDEEKGEKQEERRLESLWVSRGLEVYSCGLLCAFGL